MISDRTNKLIASGIDITNEDDDTTIKGRELLAVANIVRRLGIIETLRIIREGVNAATDHGDALDTAGEWQRLLAIREVLTSAINILETQ